MGGLIVRNMGMTASLANNMAYLDEKTGELVLSQDERDSLNGRNREKNQMKDLMNYIIWGEDKIYYDK
jgi:hypothetical protein